MSDRIAPPGIQVRDLSLRFGRQVIFDRLSFDIAGGSVVALLGASGAGKTSLLKIIAGLMRPTAGEVTGSDGLPIAGRIAYMGQKDLLYPWLTVAENISLGARLRGEKTDREWAGHLLERVGLSGYAKALPSALSGGMRQRAAIARTLYERQPIVLMDEPFSALDAITRAMLQTLAAEQIGAFKAEGLEVKIVPPSDPALPPRLVAAKQADLAITYQPQLHFFADQGLPLLRVGTLINSPLNTLMTLDKSITSPADLKGKKIGYSVSGIEQATLATMAKHAHLDPNDMKLINVNFQLTSALLAGQVDAVIGGYRNIEALELKLQGKNPVVFNVEDYGVPAYDELIIVANRDAVAEPKIKKFLAALKKGNDYLQAHPQETWLAFANTHPELNTELNKQAWQASLPLFATDPARLDTARYQTYEQFLFDNKLIKKITPVEQYAVELH